MSRALVVADDLTGATDTGHVFASRGYDTSVARTETTADAAVVVHDTATRSEPPDVAAARVESVIDRHRESQIYKKIDSTLRGNVVAEIDAALEASGAAVAVVAPAFPAQGRYTVGGVHGVATEPPSGPDGTPAFDRSTELVELFGSSRYYRGHCDAERIDRGDDAVRERIETLAGDAKRAILTCDATTEGQLATIAEAVWTARPTVLPVGSAGLARVIRIDPPQPVLSVIGSVAATTLEQLDRVPSSVLVELDVTGHLREGSASNSAPVERAIQAAVASISTAGHAVVTAARSRADVQATMAAGRDAGLAEETIRARVASALGEVARRVAARRSVRLVLSGGSVADATLEALDASGVHLTGHGIAEGIPIGRVRGGAADGTLIVTKAGGFGGPETIVNTLRLLSRYNAQS